MQLHSHVCIPPQTSGLRVFQVELQGIRKFSLNMFWIWKGCYINVVLITYLYFCVKSHCIIDIISYKSDQINNGVMRKAPLQKRHTFWSKMYNLSSPVHVIKYMYVIHNSVELSFCPHQPNQLCHISVVVLTSLLCVMPNDGCFEKS